MLYYYYYYIGVCWNVCAELLMLMLLMQCRTEWQNFLGECLEIMAKISQLYPHVVFSLLVMSPDTILRTSLMIYINDNHNTWSKNFDKGPLQRGWGRFFTWENLMWYLTASVASLVHRNAIRHCVSKSRCHLPENSPSHRGSGFWTPSNA